MGIVLDLFEDLHLYQIGGSGEVISCQVHQHHVLSIFLRVVVKLSCQLGILGIVACATEGTSDWVEGGFLIFDHNLCFGGTPKDLEGTVVEVEEVRRRIDRAEGTVDVKLVSFEGRGKASGEHQLEYIPA